MKELIARLEAATEGSRELDIAIAKVVGWWAEYDKEVERARDRGEGYFPHENQCPEYSQSIDAALTLVPEGCRWDIQQDRTAAFASIDGETTGRCATPALALCIASLKARS